MCTYFSVRQATCIAFCFAIACNLGHAARPAKSADENLEQAPVQTSVVQTSDWSWDRAKSHGVRSPRDWAKHLGLALIETNKSGSDSAVSIVPLLGLVAGAGGMFSSFGAASIATSAATTAGAALASAQVALGIGGASMAVATGAAATAASASGVAAGAAAAAAAAGTAAAGAATLATGGLALGAVGVLGAVGNAFYTASVASACAPAIAAAAPLVQISALTGIGISSIATITTVGALAGPVLAGTAICMQLFGKKRERPDTGTCSD